LACNICRLEGRKELVGFTDAARESAQDWPPPRWPGILTYDCVNLLLTISVQPRMARGQAFFEGHQ
jgi:hypothetical protein